MNKKRVAMAMLYKMFWILVESLIIPNTNNVKDMIISVINFRKLYSKYDMHLINKMHFPRMQIHCSTNICNFRHSFILL